MRNMCMDIGNGVRLGINSMDGTLINDIYCS